MGELGFGMKEWRIGGYKIQLAIQQWFRLDGGIIFSGVPREKWREFSMGVSTLFDERNRVQLAVNCFLVTAPSGLRTLVDTGFGHIQRWKERDRDSFHMQDGFNLFDCGHSHQLPQPHFVIPTHLHFDHSGGCLKVAEGKFIPAFPHAWYIFHKAEVAHARAGHHKTRSSYLRENIEGINALLEQKRVLQIGLNRWENVLGERGLTLIRTGGHTPGHMSLKIESEGQVAFIPGALAPTRWHINILGCTVGNDVYAKQSVDRKK